MHSISWLADWLTVCVTLVLHSKDTVLHVIFFRKCVCIFLGIYASLKICFPVCSLLCFLHCFRYAWLFLNGNRCFSLKFFISIVYFYIYRQLFVFNFFFNFLIKVVLFWYDFGLLSFMLLSQVGFCLVCL